MAFNLEDCQQLALDLLEPAGERWMRELEEAMVGSKALKANVVIPLPKEGVRIVCFTTEPPERQIW